MMAVEKYLTLENVLKVLLAIAVGVVLYKIFFKREETYYDYKSPDGDESGYAYPMDYEETDEPQEMIDEYAAEDVPDYEDDEVIEEEVVEDYEDDDIYTGEEDDMYDGEDDEVIVEDGADDDQYDYEETDGEPYDDSVEQVDDAEDDFEVPDEVYEEADAENTDAYEYLYADDVEEGLQENFTLYSNLVGVDTSYD